MKPVFILAAVLFCPFIQVQAQLTHSQWYFGDSAGLDFSTGSPVALTDGVLFSEEGSSSMADASGNLLLYTNGHDIWNKNHVVMPNGSGLLGHVSSTQSSLIVKRPGSASKYFVFTTPAQSDTLVGLCYSEVDMALDGGLGDITATKNIQLYLRTCEKLTAVLHDNGTDIWLISHEWDSDAFYAYLVTAAGVSSMPVISHTGAVLTGIDPFIETLGCIKVSRDRAHLATANYGNYASQVFDFNSATGVIDNPITITGSYRPYGVEFSPSGRFLYISQWQWSGSNIYQYDLQAADVALSGTVVGNIASKPAATLQCGPDCRIYIAAVNATALSLIAYPDLAGTACGFSANSISLAGKISMAGLPNFMVGSEPPCVAQNNGIGEWTASEKLNLYPNPSTGKVKLEWGDVSKPVSLSIQDLSGVQVFQASYPAQNTIDLDLTRINKGMYLVWVSVGDERFVSRLVIE